MNSSPYSARVRDYFTQPAHAGALATGQSVLLEGQDVRLQLAAAVRCGRVEAMRFKAWGCPHTIAAAEAACRTLEGRPVEALLEFSAHGLMEELPVPVEKTGRILLLEDAVHSLGHRFGDGP